MADINVQTDGIRTGFAYNEAIQIDLAGMRQHLTSPSACLAQRLPGCVAFRQADQQSSDEVVRMLTRADQAVKGLRQGAKRIADLYDDNDAEVAVVQTNVDALSPREPGLPPVDEHLQLAQRLNDPLSQ